MKFSTLSTVIILAVLPFIGCEPQPKPTPSAAEVQLGSTATRAEILLPTVGRTNATASEANATIGAAVESAVSKTPAKVLPILQPDYSRIRSATTRQAAALGEQFNAIAELAKVVPELKAAQQLVVDNDAAWKKKYEGMRDERDQAIRDRDSSLNHSRVAWVTIFGVVMALGAAAVIFGSETPIIRRAGYAAVGAGLTGILMWTVLPAISLAADLAIPIIGIGLAVIALGLLVCLLWKYRDQLFVQEKAIVQLTDSTQRVREFLNPDQDKAIFGVPERNAYPFPPQAGILDHVQDDQTKALVDEAQDALGHDKDAIAAAQNDEPQSVRAAA